MEELVRNTELTLGGGGKSRKISRHNYDIGVGLVSHKDGKENVGDTQCSIIFHSGSC